jgi:hypothetical protein
MRVKFDKKSNKVELKTNHGTLVLDVFDNEDYPAFNIDFKLKGHEAEPAVPICMVEDASVKVSSDETNGEAVVVRVWGNPCQEDYTERVDVPIKDIKRFYEEDEMVVCPECEMASSIWAWNKATRDCYGDEGTGIVPMTEEDFDKEDGQLLGPPAHSLFKCPKCRQEDIPGTEICLNGDAHD